MALSNTLYSIFEGKETNAKHAALIVPSSAPLPTVLTYPQLLNAIRDFSAQLTAIVPELAAGDAVAIAYPNSVEFVVSFLATGMLRLVSAPLNPAYTEDEFNFYLEDSKAKVILLPPGASNDPKNAAVRAARKQNTAVVQVYWNGTAIELHSSATAAAVPEPRHHSLLAFQPQPDDVALLLHTSGTTGRPKG